MRMKHCEILDGNTDGDLIVNQPIHDGCGDAQQNNGEKAEHATKLGALVAISSKIPVRNFGRSAMEEA